MQYTCRHPLKFIASMLKHTHGVAVARETKKPNMAVWKTIVEFTPAKDASFHYNDNNGRHLLRPGLERIMEHWLSWNIHVERVADARIKIEEFDALALCELSGLSVEDCQRAREEPPCGFVGKNASLRCAAAARVATSNWTT